MASRYSNLPVSLYQDRSWDKFFFFFSVWMWTVILRFDTSAVSMSVYVCVFRARQMKSLQSGRVVHLWQSQTSLSYPPIIVFCYLACLSGRHCEKKKKKPEQALLRRGLTKCFSDCHECFLKIGKCQHQALSLAQLVHACIISHCKNRKSWENTKFQHNSLL